MSNVTKIQSFTDLTAWKEGHALVLNIYKITFEFPHHQTYSLTNQMQRASVSITSNIAEGFSRRTRKDKVQFYYMALGSTTEIQNQLVIARDLGYLKSELFQSIAQQTVQVHKLINGLIKSAASHG